MKRFPKNVRTALLGIGLDNQDGHHRITTAEQFAVIGGSCETHERMTETLIKTLEYLQRSGQSLETTDARQLAEIIRENTPH